VHLVLGLLGVIWADMLSPGLLRPLVAASAVLQLQSFLICICPFSFLGWTATTSSGRGQHPRLSQESSHFVLAPSGSGSRRAGLQPAGGRLRLLLRAVAALRRRLRRLNAWLIFSARHA
jgi:hypothetical protein